MRVQQIHSWVNQVPTIRRTDQRQDEIVSAKALHHPRQGASSQNVKTAAMVVEKNLDSRRQKLEKKHPQNRGNRPQKQKDSRRRSQKDSHLQSLKNSRLQSRQGIRYA